MELKIDIAHSIKSDLNELVNKLSPKLDDNGICTYVPNGKDAFKVLDDLERLVQHYKYS